MKRLARRTAMIERSTARRAALNERRSEKDKKWEAERSMISGRREVIDSMVSARQRRREHWELGSALAPNRDHVLRGAQLTNGKYQGIPSAAVIAFRDDGSPFGAIGQNRYQPDIDATEEALEARCAWAGGVKYLCLAPGDRVVITEGPYKGKIGPITALDKKRGAVQIESVVLVNVSVPQAMVGPEGKGLTRTPVITVPDWLPISAVRLVHPVTDYTTNITRDVIIKQLIPIRKYVDRPTGRTTFQRLVAGLNIIVPWPKIDPVEHKDHPVDTLRIDVEEKTFVPTLLHPPMPSQILDELRGKYSRFRTRHTDEFIAKVEANEAERARLKSKTVDPTMRTPLQDLNRQLRQERKALGQPELSEEMLEKIGRVIARNIRLYEEGEVAEQQSYSAARRRDQEVMREALRKERQEKRSLEGQDQ